MPVPAPLDEMLRKVAPDVPMVVPVMLSAVPCRRDNGVQNRGVVLGDVQRTAVGGGKSGVRCRLQVQSTREVDSRARVVVEEDPGTCVRNPAAERDVSASLVLNVD
jgi:hypothetical protein